MARPQLATTVARLSAVKLMRINMPARFSQAAGAIHGDFERGFICADVMAYEVLKEIGTEAAVKAAGKLRQEGKNYLVADGGALLAALTYYIVMRAVHIKVRTIRGY